MDFIIGLPPVSGKSVIVVVMDWLTKYCHLGKVTAGYTVAFVAEYFVQQIVRLHEIPKTIVSDRERFL